MSHSISDNCIGCHLCARNCPVGAISGDMKALHHVDDKLCIDCGLCGRLCPKGAVLDSSGCVADKMPKDKWIKPVIDEELCAGCSVCVENCPASCLSLSDPAFHGDIHTFAVLTDPEACIGCRICGGVCPIDAIQY